MRNLISNSPGKRLMPSRNTLPMPRHIPGPVTHGTRNERGGNGRQDTGHRRIVVSAIRPPAIPLVPAALSPDQVESARGAGRSGSRISDGLRLPIPSDAAGLADPQDTPAFPDACRRSIFLESGEIAVRRPLPTLGSCPCRGLLAKAAAAGGGSRGCRRRRIPPALVTLYSGIVNVSYGSTCF
jgi:hypothetical protein